MSEPAAGEGWHVPWLFGVRYLRARRRARFVSFTAVSALLGLALGIMVLITVLAIMNGFGEALRTRILGSIPHVTVLAADDPAAVPGLLQQVRAVPANVDVLGSAPLFEAQAMVIHQGAVVGLGLLGIAPELEAQVSILPRHIVEGQLAALRTTPDGVVIGEPLASHLGVRPGDRIVLLVPLPDGRDGVRSVTVALQLVATYRVDAEVDYQLALVDYRNVAGLGLAAAGRFGVRVQAAAPLQAEQLASELRAVLPASLRIDSWTTRFGELFQAVGMEKTLMGMLLGLVVAIASFNVVATLVMLVDDKRGDIAVLRSLGASAPLVGRVFLVHGLLVVSLGLVLGVAGGVLLASHVGTLVLGIQWLLGVDLLAGTYFSTVPSVIDWSDVAIVVLIGALISIAAVVYPARRAAAADPLEGLHRE